MALQHGSQVGLCEQHTQFEQGDEVKSPFATVTAAFYHYATTCPNLVAVRDLTGESKDVTYRSLAIRVQQLASVLRSRGVTPGQKIPLVVKRGLDMIVGLWAILTCGAQYVPLDGGVVPDNTIRQVLEQAEGPVVLCLTSTVHRLQKVKPNCPLIIIDEHNEQVARTIQSEPYNDLSTTDGGCYIIYTSGTTGKPKGVDVTHKNVVNLVCLAPGNLNITPGTRVGSLLNISFDMAAWEIFACLCNGGTLVIRGSYWEKALEQIDVLICTPTILSKYHPSQFPDIMTVVTAGEPTTRAIADLWASTGTYWNCCGPTETTIVNTMQKHNAGDELSIGRPTPNNSVYILDRDQNRVEVGETGIMWAGGQGVTRGYVGLEGKTAKKYKRDPFANNGTKMYNTGDLGRWREDGTLEILGRVDDQVKVKGFRVELDGISASLAAGPGVSQATVLLSNGEIHGFVAPSNCDVSLLTQHMQRCQPYYAVPTSLHAIDRLPMTANGKVDKQALKVISSTRPTALLERLPFTRRPSIAEEGTVAIHMPTKPEPVRYTGDGHCKGGLKMQMSTSTLSSMSTLAEKSDLLHDVPRKRWAQPFRGLRHRVFIAYRSLCSVVGLANLVALICVLVLGLGSEWMGSIMAINLGVAVLVRQDMVINALYTVACSMPKQFPLAIRKRCAKIYHLGGVHSGAGVCATTWLIVATVRGSVCREVSCEGERPSSLATQVLSWLLCSLCCIMVASAWPSFRKQHHDIFERFHRFAGWTTLVLFWARTMLAINDAHPEDQSLGVATAKSPVFWLLAVATLSVASSWFSLRRVPVDAEVLSDHAVRLHFDYTVPVNGSFTRLSRRPLLEWHSFATIPAPEATQDRGKGYSLVISNAGDWTRDCIRNPPRQLWVRGIPTCGVMRIATLFNRLVVIATGSGIGPLLGHIGQQSCPTQLIWSASRPEKTFGKDTVAMVRERIPDAVIHDTKALGRPDLVRMGFNLAQNFGAEAVIVIANEKITKKIVYGLETRGMPAYGAIWDS